MLQYLPAIIVLTGGTASWCFLGWKAGTMLGRLTSKTRPGKEPARRPAAGGEG
jgi:hypothetical protein